MKDLERSLSKSNTISQIKKTTAKGDQKGQLVTPFDDPIFEAKPLNLEAHDYADGISDYQINDMRVRAQ